MAKISERDPIESCVSDNVQSEGINSADSQTHAQIAGTLAETRNLLFEKTNNQ